MSEKTHYTVARNEGYSANSIGVQERHNERKNEEYYNADIVSERKELNHYYQQWQYPDGTPLTYAERFKQMLAAGTIVKRGTKENAKVFNELIFDVNTSYFDERGGYDFAVKFYEETYKMAVKEIGSEQYVISAVMHADERNVALSEQLGRDVYHYHLHVVYVPVVEKEVLWTKRCKDPALVGKVKEVIPQISHSKKWHRGKDENGKWVDTYSLLQDHYHDHMKAAGFDGFVRGERGSTTEHLEVLDYKIQQDKKRAKELSAEVEQKQEAVAALDKQVDKKEARINKLDEKIAVKTKAAATIDEVEAMGKPARLGNGFSVTADEMKTLKTLAKKSVTADDKLKEERRKRKLAESERDEAKAQIAEAKKNQPTISEHLTWFNKFIAALKRAPKRLMEVIEDILRKPPEQAEPERTQLERSKNKSRAEAR